MNHNISADALTDAAFNGDLEAVRTLVEAGADVNTKGRVWNPLCAAIENNHSPVIQYLLNAGADPDFRHNGLPALHHMIDVEMDGYQQGNTPVLPSADLVKLLVEVGADISLEYDGQTPLQLAEWYHHEAAIKYLQSQVIQLTAQQCAAPFA